MMIIDHIIIIIIDHIMIDHSLYLIVVNHGCYYAYDGVSLKNGSISRHLVMKSRNRGSSVLSLFFNPLFLETNTCSLIV